MKNVIIIGIVLFSGSTTILGQLTNSGNLRTFSGANVTVYGDITNNGTLIDSGTLVTLAGANLQTIGGTSLTTLNNLRLNNSSVTGVTLNNALNVRGTLTFSDGYLNTTALNILTLTATASVSGPSNNSFVSGPVRKTGNTAFVFPVGKNIVYAPIAISAPALINDQFTGEYFQVSPDALYSTSSLETGVDHVSQCEYWMLDRTTGTSDVAVTLSWENIRSCGVNDPPDLLVVRWSGTQWTNKGNGGTTGTSVSGTVVSSAPVTGFGPFTLGSSTADNALPVELAAFSAQCEEEEVVLRWSTESEFENAYFTIEASTDGYDWKNAGVVEGSGTSSVTVNYSWTDSSNPGRDMYYRLSQTNFNGETTIHSVVFLENCISGPENGALVYPNPGRNVVSILSAEKITGVVVFDTEGKTIAVPYDTEFRQLDFSSTVSGVYVIRISTAQEVYMQKVVISRP